MVETETARWRVEVGCGWPTIALVALGLAPAIFAMALLWDFDASGILAHNGKLLSWDFTSTWAGGVLGRQGRFDAIYDQAAYSAWLRGLYGPSLANHEWLYPPHLLLLAVPLGTLALPVAYCVWTLGTIGLLLGVMRLAGFGTVALTLTAFSPALWKSINYGQNGALTAAFLVGGLALARRKPTLAGLLLGGLVIKPHLALLAPIYLIATRNWRVLWIAAATAVGLTLATLVLFGAEPFILFVTKAQPLMKATLEAPWPTPYQMNGMTVFMLARAWGASVAAAYGWQALCASFAAVTVWIAAQRRPGEEPLLIALTLCLTFLVTPYAFAYDCVPLQIACLILVAAQDGRWTAAPALAWIWPGLANFVAFVSAPIAPLITMLLAAAIAAHIRGARDAEGRPLSTIGMSTRQTLGGGLSSVSSR